MKAICVALLMLSACEGLSDRTKYLTGAEAFQWQSGSRFTIRGQKKMWGQVNVFADSVRAFVKGFPPGTRISLGDGKATVAADGNAQFDTTVTSLLGALPFGNLQEDKVDRLVLVVQPPAGSPIQVRVPAQANVGLEQALLKITEGPVRFGAEPAEQSGPIRNVLWLDSTRDESVLFGQQPKQIKDVDALAVVKRLSGPFKICTGYKGDDGKAMPDIKLHLEPAQATVYARRTGKVIATRTFPADDRCPDWAMGRKDRSLDRESDLPEADLRAWLTEQVAAK